MNKLWYKLSHLGVTGNTNTYEQKSLIILNQLAMLGFPCLLYTSDAADE